MYRYLQADYGLVLLDIIDRSSIIVKVNLKAKGFIEFTSLTLPLQTVKDLGYINIIRGFGWQGCVEE